MDSKKSEVGKVPSKMSPAGKSKPAPYDVDKKAQSSKNSEEEEILAVSLATSSSDTQLAASTEVLSVTMETASSSEATASTSAGLSSASAGPSGSSSSPPRTDASKPSTPSTSPYKCKKRERLVPKSLEERPPGSSSDEGFLDDGP